MIDCHGLLSKVSWIHVPDQVVWLGVGLTPTILNSEISQGLGSTFLVLLSGDMTHLLPPPPHTHNDIQLTNAPERVI